MDNRLYVTNLSTSASLTSLRQCFAACGEVSEIEFAVERNAPRASSSAFVTMASSADAELAIRRLNGTSLDGRSLMVTLVPGRAGSNGQRSEHREGGSRKAAAPPAVAITQQYRERHNMTYELDCKGTRLILRMFFPPLVGGSEWRVEARSAGDLGVVEKVAATRAIALKEISAAWQELVTTQAVPSFDWPAVILALQGVRAL